jgi:tetratricopeptide (TPR) repeat protein
MKEAAAAYQQAILLLDEYPIDGMEEKSARAKALLEQAAASRPAHARTQAALGYACDLRGEAQQALACFREAQRLEPKDRIVEVYVLTLLAERCATASSARAISSAPGWRTRPSASATAGSPGAPAAWRRPSAKCARSSSTTWRAASMPRACRTSCGRSPTGPRATA